jgi:anti-anti-sigma factor
MDVMIQERGAIRLVRPHGEMSDEGELDEFAQGVTDLISPGVAGIVLDLSQVTFVSSAGLTALVRIVAQGNVQETPVLLAAPVASLAGLLEVTRLNRFMQTRSDVEAAVRELAEMQK